MDATSLPKAKIAKVDIFDPAGNLLASFPHTLSFTRITFEPLD